MGLPSNNFTPQEWTKVLESTMVAGIAIAVGGAEWPVGHAQGIFATGALDATRLDPGANELIKAVIADFETSEGRLDVQKALDKRFGDAEEPSRFVERSLAGYGGLPNSRCQGT